MSDIEQSVMYCPSSGAQLTERTEHDHVWAAQDTKDTKAAAFPCARWSRSWRPSTVFCYGCLLILCPSAPSLAPDRDGRLPGLGRPRGGRLYARPLPHGRISHVIYLKGAVMAS